MGAAQAATDKGIRGTNDRPVVRQMPFHRSPKRGSLERAPVFHFKG